MMKKTNRRRRMTRMTMRTKKKDNH
jgi:hypothetical protein